MERYAISRIVLKPDQLEALGAVVAESSYIEALLDVMIGNLLRLDVDRFAIVMKGAMINAKLEMLAEIGELKLKSKRRRQALAKIISNLKALNTQRITAVHGVWIPEIDRNATNQLRQALLPSGEAAATHRKGKLTARKLKNLAERMSDGYWDLLDFNARVWITPKARSQRLKLARLLAKSGQPLPAL